MNKLFEKYLPDWYEILGIIHEHWIKIVDRLILNVILLVLIPSFLYYYSIKIQELIPFYYFEIYLIFMYFKIIYDILDWYYDVWIITNNWVVDLNWSLFKTKIETIAYENIEWIEIEQDWIIDKILNKWDIVIHKFWDEELRIIDAIAPFSSINMIEEHLNQNTNDEEEIDKFDLVMDTLAWVVKEYLNNKSPNMPPCEKKYNNEENNLEQELENIKKQDWVIDLR